MTEITERLKIAIADRYRPERELGQGGMATVYLAADLKHDRADLMFSLAQMAGEIGDREDPVIWLVRSIDGGYSLRSVRREPQLAGVRTDPRVQAAEAT